jgi:thiol-disulfide isomerase/thioredoxin
VLLLVSLTVCGQDAPNKEDKPPTTAKVAYDKLLQELADANKARRAEAAKTSSLEVMEQIYQKYVVFQKAQAEKLVKLAEDHPTDPVATDAVFYVTLRIPDGHPKAEAKVIALIAELPLKDLTDHIGPPGRSSAQPSEKVQAAILKRAEKDIADPLAGNLIAWLTHRLSFGEGPSEPPVVDAAIDLLLAKHPDHAAWVRICATREHGGREANAVTLRKIAAKTTSPRVKALATFALGQYLLSRIDILNSSDKTDEAGKLVDEADRTMADAVAAFGKVKDAEKMEEAEQSLKTFRTLRVGKPAPEIVGKDVDGKELKLSDFRGKVVLLDFWAFWCGPCRSMFPHQRSLVKRLADEPFALIGVNADQDPDELRKLLIDHNVTWRSFWDGPKGKGLVRPIAREWDIRGWPTIYLIDHKGVIRHKFYGSPDNEEEYKKIDAIIDKVVAEAKKDAKGK